MESKFKAEKPGNNVASEAVNQEEGRKRRGAENERRPTVLGIVR